MLKKVRKLRSRHARVPRKGMRWVYLLGEWCWDHDHYRSAKILSKISMKDKNK